MAEAFRATTAPLSGSIPTKAAARPGAPAPRSCELFRPLALVPVYNHPDTIAAVVKDLRAMHLPVLIVDDGSDERTRTACDALTGVAVTVVHRAQNGGKGAAMMTGFKRAAREGYTHVLQIDADGQHDRAAVSRFIQLAHKFPNHLICGYPVYDSSVPKARLWGRKITNFWVAVNSLSLSFEDAMCGMRVYPIEAVTEVLENARIGERMEFDPEILVRLLWAGVRVKNAPVAVTYPKDGISHFRGLRDNLRISWMHAKLCTMMLTRLPIILWSRVFGRVPECERDPDACRPVKPAKLRPTPDTRTPTAEDAARSARAARVAKASKVAEDASREALKRLEAMEKQAREAAQKAKGAAHTGNTENSGSANGSSGSTPSL